MIVNSVSNRDLFKILDEITNETYYGGNQQWYSTEWQRLSGCGPTAVSNIIYYLKNNNSLSELVQGINTKKNWSSFMEEVWQYVTPTSKGIPTTSMFYQSVLSYAKSKGIDVKFQFCDLPEDKLKRPKLSEVVSFLEKALINDVPVAFLNLCNGEEKNLEGWHWVTIISLKQAEDGTSESVEVLDEGVIKEIDLMLWYKTTTLGGGFVYFTDYTEVQRKYINIEKK